MQDDLAAKKRKQDTRIWIVRWLDAERRLGERWSGYWANRREPPNELVAMHMLHSMALRYRRRAAAYRRYIMRRFGVDPIARRLPDMEPSPQNVILFYIATCKWQTFCLWVAMIDDDYRYGHLLPSERLRAFLEWVERESKRRIHDLTFDFIEQCATWDTLPMLVDAQVTLKSFLVRTKDGRVVKVGNRLRRAMAWSSRHGDKPGDAQQEWHDVHLLEVHRAVADRPAGTGPREFRSFVVNRIIKVYGPGRWSAMPDVSLDAQVASAQPGTTLADIIPASEDRDRLLEWERRESDAEAYSALEAVCGRSIRYRLIVEALRQDSDLLDAHGRLDAEGIAQLIGGSPEQVSVEWDRLTAKARKAPKQKL